MYEHRLIVLRERDLRAMIAKAIQAHEAELARTIVGAVDPALLYVQRWLAWIRGELRRMPTAGGGSPCVLISICWWSPDHSNPRA